MVGLIRTNLAKTLDYKISKKSCPDRLGSPETLSLRLGWQRTEHSLRHLHSRINNWLLKGSRGIHMWSNSPSVTVPVGKEGNQTHECLSSQPSPFSHVSISLPKGINEVIAQKTTLLFKMRETVTAIS